jgi:hypothetical protein
MLSGLKTSMRVKMVNNINNIPKVVGSIPTVARHIFQARPVWIYTQSNIANIIFTRVHNTNTEKMTSCYKFCPSLSERQIVIVALNY